MPFPEQCRSGRRSPCARIQVGWPDALQVLTQAVDQLGKGLLVSAISEDGIVEGIEIPGKRFAVAVQWHPEDQAATDPVQARLFSAFAESLPDK